MPTRIRLLLITCILCASSMKAELIQLEDNQGRIINAELIETADNYLTILREDGRRYTFPMTMLNGRSQERVKRAFTVTIADPNAPKTEEPRQAPSESVQLALKFNGPPPKEISVTLSNSDTRKSETVKIDPSSTKVDWTDLKDGRHTIAFRAEGYAYQWYRIQVRNGKVSPVKLTLDFRKKRYVIMRYAINLHGEPDFSVPDIYTGIAAFSELTNGNPQHFLGWQVRQASPGETRYGDDFFINWKWMTSSAGIQVRKQKFSEIKSAAGNKFSMTETELKRGLVFTCKSSYSRAQLYGKFEVVDVVDEPPADLEVY